MMDAFLAARTLSRILLSVCVCLIGTKGFADTFGTGPNVFTIDFVPIGNPGNPDDAGAGGGLYSSPYGGVLYEYRMGVFEISRGQITSATASGLTNVTAGDHSAAEPAAQITWFEAAAFVNWLNTSTGHQAAYNLNATATALTLWTSAEAWDNDPGIAVDLNLFRHKNAYYFLPSEDEWYKAAYHQNDGITANYWDYAVGSNSAPTQELTGGTTPGSAVYNGVEPGSPADPADVTQAGGLSSYGTMAQNGNIFEWTESASDGVNNSPTEQRALRGGRWTSSENTLRSSTVSRGSFIPGFAITDTGFRVASVPEPSSAALLLSGGGALLFRRKRIQLACISKADAADLSNQSRTSKSKRLAARQR